MSVENMGNGYVKVGIKQEDLEESIAGLRQRQHIRKGAQYSICKAFNKTCIAIRIYADYHTFVFDTGIK